VRAAGRNRKRLRALQVALGSLWLLDAALQAQPVMFGRSFVTQAIEPNAAGQPGAIGHPILWMGHLIAPQVALFNALAVAIQLLIGLGLMHPRTVKPALLASFAWAAGIWWFGEGLGMLFTGDASPLGGAPGAVLLYALVGAVVWPDGRAAGGVGLGRAADGLARGAAGGLGRTGGGLLGARGVRVAWAALWLLAAGLWLAPANRAPSSVHDALTAAPGGVAWLAGVEHSAASAAAGGGLAIAIVLAVASAAIGISALLGWQTRPFLVLACLLSLAYWVLGQGLGGVFTGSATDPNAGPLFVLLAIAVHFTLTPAGSLPRVAEPARPRSTYTINGRSWAIRPVGGAR
jgi:hypothetical protein